MLPRRLARLPALAARGELRVHVARSRRSRLLGLALLRDLPAGHALLIPRCDSVHTFGMRFPLDLVWLDARGRVVATDRAVPPGRLVTRPAAAAVVELRADRVPPMAEETAVGRVLKTLDPREPIYRDTYNEYFVMVLSAGGAAAGTQVPLYIVMALTEMWSPGVFVAACVVFELAVIFGLARPQMKPQERVGWSLMWAAVTAALALAFYHLVATPTL